MAHGLELYIYKVDMDSNSKNLAQLVFQTLCDASLMVQSNKRTSTYSSPPLLGLLMGKNNAGIWVDIRFHKTPTSTPSGKFDGLRGKPSLGVDKG